jgi:hypothetical protein
MTDLCTAKKGRAGNIRKVEWLNCSRFKLLNCSMVKWLIGLMPREQSAAPPAVVGVITNNNLPATPTPFWLLVITPTTAKEERDFGISAFSPFSFKEKGLGMR